MSRIHEALKRAEEERLTPGDQQQPTVDSANILHEDAVTTKAAVVAAAAPAFAQQSVSAAAAPAPANGEGINWELLKQRCTLHEWKPDPGTLFLNRQDAEQVGAEQFRTLRSRLFHIRETKPLKMVMIGSAVPGEGKTFVSANLALSLARLQRRRVLVIDGDLRRSHLHEMFGTTCEPGLSDYLRGQADEFAVMQSGPVENLMLIPGGGPCSNPAELLGGGGLRRLIDRVSPMFDWIVMDSPPIVAVADASLIARICDGIVMVVHAARTPYDLAQRARREFRGFPVLGAVLNRAEVHSTYKSYYTAYGNPGKTAR